MVRESKSRKIFCTMQNAIFIILVLLFFFSSRCSIELESWTHLGFYKRCGVFVLHINTGDVCSGGGKVQTSPGSALCSNHKNPFLNEQ